jgi:hypothetical protein
MEQAIIIAGISAVLSVGSITASIYIARKSRQSTIELEEIKAVLKSAESVAGAMKELEVEGERLRIRCWALIGIATTLNDPTKQGLSPSSVKSGLREEFKHFQGQAETFLDKWALTKTDFPLGIVAILRVQRHRCRKQVAVVSLATALLERTPSCEDEAEKLLDALNTLLIDVDQFIKITSTVRKALVNGDLSSGWNSAILNPQRREAPKISVDSME